MPDDTVKNDAGVEPSASGNQATEDLTPRSPAISALTETKPASSASGWLPPRLALVVAVAAIASTILIAYWLWSRNHPGTVATERPPTHEGKRAGEEGEKGGDEHSQEGAIEINEETAKLVGIKTEEVIQGQIEETIATTGKVFVAPNAQAIVGAKVDGRAVRVLAEPGQAVGAGQVLVVVDSPQIADLRGQLIEARARLQLAGQKIARTMKSENRAAVIQAKNRLDLAQVNLGRKRRLAELGAAARREVDEAEMEYKNAKAEHDYQSSIQITREQQEAESEVSQARATVARITQSLAALGASPDGQGGIINVTSPIAGAVVDRHVTVGQTVTPDKELLTVMNTSNVIVEAQLPESQANIVRVGQRLTARTPGVLGDSVTGQVQSVGNTVDPAKRTVPVRARVSNVGAHLKHEMAVEVRIVSGGRKDALVVPVSALVDDEGVKVVYVKEGNRYERRQVQVGIISFQLAEILSGVEAGEEVVTTGAYQIKNMSKGGGEEGGHHDDH